MSYLVRAAFLLQGRSGRPPSLFGLPSKLCVMSMLASSSDVLPASPDLESDSDVTLVLGGVGEVGVSPSGVEEGASPSAGDAGAAPCVKDEVLGESPAKKPRT